MINLLSPDARKNLSAGRTNTILLRYLWITFALLALLGALSIFTYFVLNTTKDQAERQKQESSTRIAEYQNIQQRQEEFQNHLSVAKAILDQQTNYSDVLVGIAKLMRPGTALSSITLDYTTYGTPMDLQVNATSEAAALDLKNSFQNSSLFTDVKLKSLTISDDPNVGYPVVVQMEVTISKEGAAAL